MKLRDPEDVFANCKRYGINLNPYFYGIVYIILPAFINSYPKPNQEHIFEITGNFIYGLSQEKPLQFPPLDVAPQWQPGEAVWSSHVRIPNLVSDAAVQIEPWEV